MIKFNKNNNFLLFSKIFFIYLIIFIKAYADDTKKNVNFVTIGTNSAPIKIKVFSSLTCPHCANFHIKVVPKIKKNYVESGKVQLIFIDFPLDEASFNASKLLHCISKEKQIAFLDFIYENQNQWTSDSSINKINNNLKEIVNNFGINSAKFDICINDEIIENKILNGRINGQQKYSINSTPTIIINEKKFEGSASFGDIKKKIEKLI